MSVYLDSSAIVKLVVAEPESRELRRLLRARATRISSALAVVEVLRAVRFQGRPALERARKLLVRMRLLRIDAALLEAAAVLDPRVLRSLDAIHLASALALGPDLEAVVTYDNRMGDAARTLGLTVLSPGARL